jgi:photosystem II stability/assembly factor-like uncharacterized protein
MVKVGTVLGAIILVAISLTAHTADGVRTWANVGPVKGGPIFPDRSDPDRWYALSWYDGILYRSDNGGRLWQKIISPTPNRFFVHPFDGTLYIVHLGATSNDFSLYVSRDRGETFVQTGKLLTWVLKADSLNSNTLYQLADPHSIYRTTDAGVHWEQISFLFTPSQTFGCSATDYSIDDLLSSPFQPNSIYLSVSLQQCPYVNDKPTNVNFIVASHDHGRTWKEEFSGKTGAFRFHFDSATADRAYAYSQQKLTVLTQEGWQKYPEPTCPKGLKCSIQKIVVVPRQINELLVVQARGNVCNSEFKICITKNNGGNWQITDSRFSSEYPFDLYLSDTQPRYQMATEPWGGGIYRKDADWQPANLGFEQRIRFMRILARRHNVYAYFENHYGYLLYRSRNEGKTWKDLRFRLPKGRTAILAVDPADAEHLIIEMARGNLCDSRRRHRIGEFYSSHDGGDSWKFLFRLKRGGDDNDVIAFDPHHSGTIFFSSGGRVFKSTEEGLHPVRLPLNLGQVRQIFFDPDKPDKIFFINGNLYQSNDGGRTAYFSGQGLPNIDDGWSGAEAARFIVSTGKGEYLVENDNAEFFRSTNGGKSWQPFSHVKFRGYDISGAGPTYSMDKKRKHLFTLSVGRLFESTDSGRFWKRINFERPRNKYYGAIIDISDPSISPLYAASDSGIWKAIHHHEKLTNRNR